MIVIKRWRVFTFARLYTLLMLLVTGSLRTYEEYGT
jgi:hypothetical protein